MWISKDKETRKREFLETAIDLFKEKGYEVTSINHILSKMNITKGSFYYHFKSKDDLLEQVIELFLGDIRTIADEVAKSNCRAIEKLEMLEVKIDEYRKEHKKLYQDLYEINKKNGNEFLSTKFYNKSVELHLEIISSIINQGKDEGVFDPVDLNETPEVFLTIANHYKKKMEEYFYSTKEEKAKEILRLRYSFQNTVERLLGTEKGELDFYTNNKH